MDQRPEKLPLGDLLCEVCDGVAQSETVRQLGQRLGDDPAAREEYLDYLFVHGLLHWDHSSAPHVTGADLREPVPQTIGATGASPIPSTPAKSALARSSILGFLGDLRADGLTTLDQPRFSLWLLLVTALASSGITAAGLEWRRAPAPERPLAKAPMAAAPRLAAERPASAPRATEFVATLVGAADARWGGAEAPADGTRLPAAEVRLAEGLAEIVFDGGAKVLLQGPARFVPQSSRGGLLHYGRLVAQVPADAPLFSVQTSMTIVVGRDAEFAIETTEAGTTKLHVYRGYVDVAGRTRHSTGMPHSRVAAGEALLVEPAPDAKLMPLEFLGEQFIRALPGRPRHFPAGLVSYWNFDEQGGPAFDVQGQHHGLLQSVTRTSGLIGKGALAFTDERGQQVSVDAQGQEFSFTTGITIEALFVSNWDAKEGNYEHILRKEDGDRRILLALQNDRDVNNFAAPKVPPQPVLSFGLNLGGEYSELDMPLDGRDGRPSLAELTDGQTHHVAATYDSASGRKAIYFDGTLRFSRQLPQGTQIVSGGPCPLTIGSMFGGWETFSGTIDEVAIYRAALTDAEVSEHWAKVRAGHGYFEVQAETAGADDI